jgi:hypothetical protein
MEHDEREGVNIIEAAKSGKRFKRIGRTDWIDPNGRFLLPFEDAIAEDYIVEEKSVTVTRSQIERACQEAIGRWASPDNSVSLGAHIATQLNLE